MMIVDRTSFAALTNTPENLTGHPSTYTPVYLGGAEFTTAPRECSNQHGRLEVSAYPLTHLTESPSRLPGAPSCVHWTRTAAAPSNEYTPNPVTGAGVPKRRRQNPTSPEVNFK